MKFGSRARKFKRGQSGSAGALGSVLCIRWSAELDNNRLMNRLNLPAIVDSPVCQEDFRLVRNDSCKFLGIAPCAITKSQYPPKHRRDPMATGSDRRRPVYRSRALRLAL